MRIAAVVIAPASLIGTAEVWARRGLVADSLWLSSDSLPEIDFDSPNALVARRLAFGQDPHDGPLALQLAGIGALDEIRVVWVRSSEDDNQEDLAELAKLLRDLLPFDRMHWIDVVVPQRRTDESVAPLAGTWVQFRIHPSDRPAPDVTDAGWDLGLAVPLHVTLAVAGILAGTTSVLPWAMKKASGYYVVRAFSRLVDGGLEARMQSAKFVNEVLPATQAADHHADSYLAADDDESERVLKAALEWMLELDSGVLSYAPPETSRFEGRRRVSLWRHLTRFARFIPTALMTLSGWEPEPDARVGHKLEFEDLGYNIGPETPVVKWTSGIPDFAQLESAAATRAAQVVKRNSDRQGARPPSAIWEPICQVATSLVDGGTAVPDTWTPPVAYRERQLTLSPQLVVLGPGEDVAAGAPDLSQSENATVASIASRYARLSHHRSVSAESEASQVTASAVRLANQANELDARELGGQLAGLGGPASPGRTASLFERLHGAVLGGLLRARLDAERWETFATSIPPWDPPDWSSTRRRLRRGLMLFAAVMSVLALIWWLGHDAVGRWLGIGLGLAAGLGVLVGVLALGGLGTLYALFRRWASHVEHGRRRLELMALWLKRATSARRRHADLVGTERATRAWISLLSNVPSADSDEAVAVSDAEVERGPMSMRIGRPKLRQRDLRTWLADAGASPGWRLIQTQDVIGRFAGVPSTQALAHLAEDSALPGGLHDELAETLDEHVDAIRTDAISQLASAVMKQISTHVDEVIVRQNPRLEDERTRIDTFLAGLTPAGDDEDDWPDDADHSWLIPMNRNDIEQRPDLIHGPPELLPSPTICDGRIRVQIIEPGLVADGGDEDSSPDPPVGLR